MFCKRCGRALKSSDSIERELGAVCEKKLQAAKAAYKPVELFDLTEYPAQAVKTPCEPIQEERKAGKVVYAVQVPMNFSPVIASSMSMLEQYRAAMKILNKRDV
jgi:hypothetical protein